MQVDAGTKGVSVGEQIAFPKDQLTIGFFVPFESFEPLSPCLLSGQLQLAKQLDKTEIAVLWARDRLLSERGGREREEMIDPWVYLGALAASTERIALGCASAIITLRHPIPVAKAAASVDRLSGGRFLLGVASGVRSDEYPAFGIEESSKAERFREAIKMIRELWTSSYPNIDGTFGKLSALDLQPKPLRATIPIIVTGGSGGQQLEWIARNSDAWFQYVMNDSARESLVVSWRHHCVEAAGRVKPLLQGVFLDLLTDPGASPCEIEQGFRGGRRALIDWLFRAQAGGISHIAFNLKRGSRPHPQVIDEVVDHVAPLFKRGAV